MEDAIDAVKSGIFTLSDIEAISAASQGEKGAAVSMLKAQFLSSEDISLKGRIASSLVRLGEKDESYWKFLVTQAIPAADNDAPFLLEVDQNGSTNLAPGFLQWAADHNISVDHAIELEAGLDPAAIDHLGYSRDERAVPILRRALSSPNFYVEMAASRSLANIHDSGSIPLITAACSKAPAWAATQIALPLVYFDDKDAQRAVTLYVPNERAVDARKARSEGITEYSTGP
ncbi:MAG: HEAT repeat domain-containing protein [Acidobacteriaceae bacterium]